MKKALLVISIISGMLLFAGETVTQAAAAPKAERVATQKEMMALSLRSMYLVQNLTKNYLYKNSGLHSTALDARIRKSVTELGTLIKVFARSTCKNSTVKHRLEIISLAEKNLQAIAQEKYSLENMQLLLDLGSVISEASAEIIAAVGEGARIYNEDSNARMPRLSAL